MNVFPVSVKRGTTLFHYDCTPVLLYAEDDECSYYATMIGDEPFEYLVCRIESKLAPGEDYELRELFLNSALVYRLSTDDYVPVLVSVRDLGDEFLPSPGAMVGFGELDLL